MTVLNLQVGNANDDAYERRSTGATVTSGIYAVSGNYNIETDQGLRWTGVSGLSGSSIDAATLNFPYAHASDSGSFVGDWYAQDAEAPAAFTTATNNLTGRPRTTTTCEGDGSDFGNWTAGDNGGSGWDFIGDGTNTIADIIQALADSYDPSAIVLIHIWATGTGERVARSYDYNSIYGAKLSITYTAGGGSTQTATPSPVAIPVTIPDPKLGLTPDPVSIPILIPDPKLGLTPDPVVIPIVIPDPVASMAGRIDPDPVVIPITIPDPAISAGAVTLTPDPVTIPIAIPAITLIGASIIHPDPVTIPIAIPDPAISPGAVTLTPDAVAIPIVTTVPVVSGAGAAEAFTQWGLIERFADPDEQPPGTTFFLEIGMFTSSAAVEVKGRVFNITDGVVVDGSEVTTTETSYNVVRSGSFSLSPGLRKYRIEFGGQQGGVFSCHGGDVKPEGS